MKRDIDLNEISDGRFYGLNDMVKADCKDCEGCWDCCVGMGDSILLDPLDVHQMSLGTGQSISVLFQDFLQLAVVDGIVLPHLKLDGDGESCRFLNEKNRCSIHQYRPGICRLFPLGRIYEDGGVRYFLQTQECKKEARGKIKVKKWLGMPDAKRYEQFIVDWHYFLLDFQEEMERQPEEEYQKAANLRLLKTFYLTPYEDGEDFYPQFTHRLRQFSGYFLRDAADVP